MGRVALIGDNSIEYVNALIDIWNSGDCAVLIDWRIPSQTIINMMMDAGVYKCYIDKQILSKTDFSSNTSILFISYDTQNSARLLPDSIKCKYRVNKSEDEAVVIYSSGTTGKSKGIVLSHFAISTNAEAILGYMKLSRSDCMYICKSLSHSSTLTGELLVSLLSNIRLIIAPTIVPPRFVLSNIIKYEVTTICVNPTLLQLYSEEVRRKECLLPSLKTIYVSGSILNDMVHNIAHCAFSDVAIYNVYGLSEAGPRVTAQRSDCCKSNSVGKPIEGVEIAIVNDTGIIVELGERGIVHVNTPSKYMYYICGEERFQSLYHNWLNTGDIGFLDINKELHIVGRVDDMINIDAHKIYPGDVEEKILSNCHVKECSVVKISHAGSDYIACLYVGDCPNMRKVLNEVLLPYEIPKVFVKCDEIPKTRNGKISKNEVRTIVLEKLNN